MAPLNFLIALVHGTANSQNVPFLSCRFAALSHSECQNVGSSIVVPRCRYVLYFSGDTSIDKYW
jgi:hypothetical protein